MSKLRPQEPEPEPDPQLAYLNDQIQENARQIERLIKTNNTLYSCLAAARLKYRQAQILAADWQDRYDALQAKYSNLLSGQDKLDALSYVLDTNKATLAQEYLKHRVPEDLAHLKSVIQRNADMRKQDRENFERRIAKLEQTVCQCNNCIYHHGVKK